MYLKRLELCGFKSFAERTRLDFEPGMMAIVGPNGCGKSNIADAIRWVLGEQSAKAMRGSKMEDVIFSGTDSQKAHGMAEVSLTLADCESSLGLEFNEVTVTRRVFRSGEGEYLLNKTPCRLRDIQRLFMDTGVGTNSYSIMEQGRIDRVLSARPEDRRAVFEEASGITKFKADKREAMRKLEQTEQNLLRLADIIREVKRQIISLQRQAGKARRYQELQARLRECDLHFIRGRMDSIESALSGMETRRLGLSEREEALASDIQDGQAAIDAARGALATRDHDMEEQREQMANVRSELDRTRETIRTNRERVAEYEQFSRQNHEEEERARAALEQHVVQQGSLGTELNEARARAAASQEKHEELAAQRVAIEEALAQFNRELHAHRAELLERENTAAALLRRIEEADQRERGAHLRRARLEVEQVELSRRREQSLQLVETLRRDRESVRARAEDLGRQCDAARADRETRASEAAALKETMAQSQSAAAALDAQIAMLEQQDREAQGVAGGARWILDTDDPGAADRAPWVRGALAGLIRAKPGYEACLQAALRPWLDAVVVRDAGAAMDLLRELDRRRAGSARLIAADTGNAPSPAPAGPGVPLINHIECAPEARDAVERLLSNVRLIPSLDELPSPLPSAGIWVTPTGQIASGAGGFEFWMAEAETTNPLARREQTLALRRQQAQCRQEIERAARDLDLRQADEGERIRQADALAAERDEARQAAAALDGRLDMAEQDLRQAEGRLEAVTGELEQLARDGAQGANDRAESARQLESARARQAELRDRLAQASERQQAMDQERTGLIGRSSEARIRAADDRRDAQDIERRLDAQTLRITELQSLIEDRARGASGYRTRIEEIIRSTAAAEDQIQPLESELELLNARLDTLRIERDEQARDVEGADHALRTRREALDGVRREQSELDVELARQRLRLQNLLDRAHADYRARPEEIRAAPEPEWGEDGAPEDADAMESRIADLKARLDSMGAVNLVAIEEYQEHEQRHSFLVQQQDDLVKSKDQLIEMIKRINQTTTQLFAETFERVNGNFKVMFGRLFGGGTAHLVLVDDGDVLESGIEIVARPPGKKPASVSLLSGGERTMTAVALLFALYQERPSPFCVLDELDAALDDTNIGRFVAIVQGFLKDSQFIVITHNRQTIAAANALYGVTMQKHGVSKIVSVRFNREGRVEHGREALGSPESPGDAESAPEPSATPVEAEALPAAIPARPSSSAPESPGN